MTGSSSASSTVKESSNVSPKLDDAEPDRNDLSSTLEVLRALRSPGPLRARVYVSDHSPVPSPSLVDAGWDSDFSDS